MVERTFPLAMPVVVVVVPSSSIKARVTKSSSLVAVVVLVKEVVGTMPTWTEWMHPNTIWRMAQAELVTVEVSSAGSGSNGSGGTTDNGGSGGGGFTGSGQQGPMVVHLGPAPAVHKVVLT